jgi:hypothetical protein
MKEALLLIFIVLASHYNNRLMISKLIRNIYHVQVPESKTYAPSKAHCFNKWCLCTYSRSRKQKTLNQAKVYRNGQKRMNSDTSIINIVTSINKLKASMIAVIGDKTGNSSLLKQI